MKKMFFNCCVLCGAFTLLSGCGNKIPEMDETSRKTVVEYAASVVREHNVNQTSKLLERDEVEKLLAEKEMREAILAQESDSGTEEQSTENESGAEALENAAQNAEPDPVTLNEALSLEEMSIDYVGHDVVDSYPQDTENVYFSMNATEGNKLLVLKFDVANEAQSDAMLDMIGKNIRYRITVNGETKNALTTMLLNDMSSYQGTIMAGESQQLVLVCEIPSEQSQTINGISLNIKSADESATIQLN